MSSASKSPIAAARQSIEPLSRAPRSDRVSPVSTDDVLRRDRIAIYFQPILSARQRAILGVEALVRVPLDDGTVIGAPSLLRCAAEDGLLAEFERRCCLKALERFASLPHRRDDHVLFVNLGSWVEHDDQSVVGALIQHLRNLGLSPAQVALEILEDRITDPDRVSHLVRRFRREGFLVVLDDVGTGHSNLERVPLLKPDILKVDRSLIVDIDTDFHKQETLKSLVGLSRRIGALVIAEGVETEREAIVSLELGAELLQGYLLGRPDSRPTMLRDGSAHPRVAIESLAAAFKTYMVDKINQRKLRHRRFNILQNEILCHLSNSDLDRFDDVLHNVIGSYPQVECMYVLDSAGVQITDTVWNPSVHRHDDGHLFRPAPKGTDHSLKEYYYILLDVELQKYTTDPYVSFASGNICHTISTYFRDARNNTLYVLCIDVLAEE